jgi:hypothetical protein
MTYDYDRNGKHGGATGAATLIKRENIEGSVVLKTFEAYGGPRKTHAVRRYYVVEWGLGRKDQRSPQFDLKRDAMAFAEEKVKAEKVDYAVGDIVEGFGRGTGKQTNMRVLVKDRKVVRDGKPGWVGLLISSRVQHDPPGTEVWGFDEDLERRVGDAPAGLEKSLLGG